MAFAKHALVAILSSLLLAPVATWRVSWLSAAEFATESSDEAAVLSPNAASSPMGVAGNTFAALQLGSLANTSLELDDFVNASLEDDLARCVITSPGGRQLQLGKTLGEGAEGTVYKARDQSGEYAAVKLLKPGRELDMQEVRNLQALSKVRSKHINNLEAGFENVQTCCGRPCLVTEIIHGKDAAKIMWDNGIRTRKDAKAGKARKGALSYKLLRSILLQSLAAFRDTEKAGLCNYDQHLRNIMFEEATERVVFIDFGHATSHVPCPPTGPFGAEYSDMGSLQSFRSLAYLLEDARDAQAYRQLCDRIVQRHYKSAEETLLHEAFSSSPPSPRSPGAFFSLHQDGIITQQLEALQATGSPHIGKVSGRGPWEGADMEVTQPGGGQSGSVARPGANAGSACARCTKGAGCALQGTCWHVVDGYQVDQASCTSAYHGEWCQAPKSSQPTAGGGRGALQPQTPPSQFVGDTSQKECCRAGGCIIGNQCFGKSQGYAVNEGWCSQYSGQWCHSDR